ncbi:MAG: nucleoside deaminase [Myxococcales bacterium]|nr:nucleoside deaminase [Myxococcales bacterium]
MARDAPLAAEARWAELLYERSRAALAGGASPFVALLVREGALVAEAANEVRQRCDPTAHAELLAIRRACAALATRDLTGATLLTSCEPCLMCLGAALAARLARICYGLPLARLAELLPSFRPAGAGERPPDVARSMEMARLRRPDFEPLFVAWTRGREVRDPASTGGIEQ